MVTIPSHLSCLGENNQKWIRIDFQVFYFMILGCLSSWCWLLQNCETFKWIAHGGTAPKRTNILLGQWWNLVWFDFQNRNVDFASPLTPQNVRRHTLTHKSYACTHTARWLHQPPGPSYTSKVITTYLKDTPGIFWICLPIFCVGNHASSMSPNSTGIMSEGRNVIFKYLSAIVKVLLVTFLQFEHLHQFWKVIYLNAFRWITQ